MYYGAIIKDSYHVEGDERSRTNPGHGYRARDVEFERFKEFVTKEAMEQYVIEQSKSSNPDDYRIVEFNPVNVDVRITTEVLTAPVARA